MRVFSFRWRFISLIAIGLCVALAVGIYRGRSDTPGVLICDFDAFTTEADRWDLRDIGQSLASDIVQRLAQVPGIRLAAMRPIDRVSATATVSERQIRWIVTGSYRAATPDCVEVRATIYGRNGQAVKSLGWYLDRRSTAWIEDRVSRDIVTALQQLPVQHFAESDTRAAIAYERGMHSLASGIDASKAYASFIEAARLWPHSPEPLRRCAQVAWLQKHLRDTVAMLTQAGSRQPDDETALLMYSIATDCRSSGLQPEGLAGIMPLCTERYPMDGNMWALYGSLLSRAGDTRTIPVLETSVLMDLVNGDDVIAAVHSLWLGEAYIQRGLPTDYDDARGVIAAAALRWKGNGYLREPLQTLGLLYADDSALLRAAARSTSPSALFEAAMWLSMNGRAKKAQFMERQVLDLLRRRFRAAYTQSLHSVADSIAAILRNQSMGHFERTAKWRRSAPSTSDRYFDQGENTDGASTENRGKGNAEYAEQVARSAERCLALLRYDPESAYAADRLIFLYTGLPKSDPDGLVEIWDRIARMGNEGLSVHFRRAQARLLRWDISGNPGDVRAAEGLLQERLDQSPASDRLSAQAAWELAERGVGLNTADAYGLQLEQTHPGDHDVGRLRGWIAVQKGDLKRGQDLLERSLDRTSPSSASFSDLCSRIGDALLRTGKWDELLAWRGNNPHDSSVVGPGYVFSSPLRKTKGSGVRIVGCGRTVAALNDLLHSSRKAVLWYFSTPSLVWSLAVGDLDSDQEQEVVVGTGSEGPVHGMVYVLDTTGHVKWRFKMGACPLNWSDDEFWVHSLAIDDVNGDGRKEVVACASHHPDYPSRICVLNAKGVPLFDFWNPGTVGAMFTARVRNHRVIVFHCVNNHQGHTNGWPACAGLIDLNGLKGHGRQVQAPPYDAIGLERVPPSELTYRSIPERREDWPRFVTHGAISNAPENPMSNVDRVTGVQKQAALLLAVGTYDHLPRLPNATKDPNTVATVLCGSGSPWIGSRLLTGSEVKLEGIENTLRFWGASRYGPPKVVYIHYSGHGYLRNGTIYLGMKSSRPDQPQTWLSVRNLLGLFGRGYRGRTVVLSLDCCLPSMDTETARDVLAGCAEAASGMRLIVWFACHPGESASEYEACGGGLFTHFVAEGIRDTAGKQWRNGELTLSSLSAYVNDHVRMWTDDRGVRHQTPLLLPSDADMLFARSSPAQARLAKAPRE